MYINNFLKGFLYFELFINVLRKRRDKKKKKENANISLNYEILIGQP
jgi:hypothetical protein